MRAVYPEDSRYVLEAFCIASGQVEFFDLGGTPIYRETFAMEDTEEEQKGYRITEDCILGHACRLARRNAVRKGWPIRFARSTASTAACVTKNARLGLSSRWDGTEC